MYIKYEMRMTQKVQAVISIVVLVVTDTNRYLTDMTEYHHTISNITCHKYISFNIIGLKGLNCKLIQLNTIVLKII